jgi:two-component system, NtrC family, sensor kinase
MQSTAEAGNRPDNESAGLESDVARLIRERDGALERQAATAEILTSIRNSTTDPGPVFDAILNNLTRLFSTRFAIVVLVRDGMLELVGIKGDPGFERIADGYPRPVDNTTLVGKVMMGGGQPMQLVPVVGNPESPPGTEQWARDFNYDALISVPLIQHGKVIGGISTAHREPIMFTDEQVDLIRSFADQAVIAVENARLLIETKEALERQTATADILKIIASSPDSVQPVFQAIVEKSNRLAGGLSTTVYTIIDDMQHIVSFTSISPEADAALQAVFPAPLSAFIWGDAVRKGEVFRVFDTEIELASQPIIRDMTRKRGFRSLVFVPLVRDKTTIGMISVTRVEPGSFAEHHVQMLRTFVDQAVIAISNVELFQNLQERTRELSQSLEDLRTAQDRLIQTEKLASLGQLTAGIAHEIKNPLNFVNNFSALSVELIDELDDTLAPASLDQKVRGDVGELTQMLKSNLEKVVQHGKRADSIVKNMLLHSREGSGEHRAADINTLVEESLNLAYHGARAEKPGFKITLKHDLDPEAGAVELYPQEITRALLNLISNGFYAATKRKSESEDETFEPMLIASTRNLGKTVEIRIRDNGTGIPHEVKEKIFNPFFTTKPAGEGTGLGLSMSHDIVVKQHGGRIDVATEPMLFTEFKIVLPRGRVKSNP